MPENAHPCTAADVTGRIVITMSDADRLELLDRIVDRVPGLDLDEHEIEWTTYPDGAQALMIDGVGMDGGHGLHALQLRQRRARGRHAGAAHPGHLGCVVIRPDGRRYLARTMPDPLAQPRSD
jgi:hypothetical protein